MLLPRSGSIRLSWLASLSRRSGFAAKYPGGMYRPTLFGARKYFGGLKNAITTDGQTVADPALLLRVLLQHLVQTCSSSPFQRRSLLGFLTQSMARCLVNPSARLPGKFTVTTKELYSMFRIQNRGAPNHLCYSGIEFYGDFAGSTGASFASMVGAPSTASASSPVDSKDAPAMCLVKRGSPNVLVFSNAARLKSGKTVSLTLSSHAGMGVGRRYGEERRVGPWRYTEAGIHADRGWLTASF